MKYFVTLTLTAAIALATSGCGGSQTCAVLQNGNKLCGQALASWCRLTDTERQQALADPYLDPSTANQLVQAQAECAEVEGSN